MTRASDRVLGIDLGTATTVGASFDGDAVEMLDHDGTTAIPTRLALSDAGFVVGEAAVAAADPVVPLPYVDRTERSLTAGPRDVPLALFLERLREVWDLSSLTDDDDGAPPRAPSDSSEESAGAVPSKQSDDVEAKRSVPEDPSDATQSNETSDERARPPTAESEALDGTTDSTDAVGTGGTTTVAVPGGYSASDISELEATAAAAGFEDVHAVRNPVAVAATELPDHEKERTIGVADVGTTWASFAVVTLDESGDVSVDARTTLTGHGREDFDAELANWVLGRVESEHGISFECDDAAMQRVRDAVHEAMNRVDPDGESAATVSLELSDGVDVTDGGLLGSDAVPVDVGLDLQSCIQALRPMLREVQSAVASLFDDGPDPDLDKLILSGDGTRPAPVLIAIENAFEQRSQTPVRGDRYTAPAVGAAILSEARTADGPTVVRETLSGDVVLRAQGEDGLEERSITRPADGPGDTRTSRLAPPSSDQLSGQFQVAYRHRLSGELEHVRTIGCTNLPSSASATELAVTVDPATALLDAEAVDVAVDIDTSSERDRPVVAQDADGESLPWLAHADVDDPDPREVTSESAFRHRSDRERAMAAVDSRGVARAAWKIRNKIWTQAIRDEQDLSRDDIELLLREFDKNLRIQDVEIIEPEVGESLDTSRHSVGRATDSDEKEGTILDVLSVGFAVDGVVVEAAEVEAAK
jgi:hypothetical protein